MIDLKEILDFKDQHVVDELYKRLKENENFDGLDEVYLEISNKNNTKLQKFQYHYDTLIQKIRSLLSVIGWTIFAFFFIMGGAFISATFVGYILISNETFRNPFLFFYGMGFSFTEMFFPILAKPDPSLAFIYCVVGLTVVFVIFYTLLYIISLFKKRDKKINNRQLSLKDSYYYLKCCEDDAWFYVKTSFHKRIHKRYFKDFFDLYYQSYLTIASHYQYEQGTIKDLTRQQQIWLCIRTFTNIIKNVFGAFAMPMYMSLAFIIAYNQNFNAVSNLKLKTIFEVIPFGNVFYVCLDICYEIISWFPISRYYSAIDLEFAKVISFCICMTIIWALCTILRTRVIEIKRQYFRRLQFYLKKNAGLYDQKQKFPAEYLYGVQFTVFLFFICVMMSFYQFFVTSLPYPIQDILKVMDHRQEVLTQIQPYVEKENQILGNWDEYFSSSYITIDSLSNMKVTGDYNEPYLKIYTCYTEEDAKNMFDGERSVYKQFDIIDESIQYAYSPDGFMIWDQTVVIKMKNDKSLLGKRMSEKEMKALIQEIGYTIDV